MDVVALCLTVVLWWSLLRPLRTRVLAASAAGPPRVRPDLSTAVVTLLAGVVLLAAAGRPGVIEAVVIGLFAATVGTQAVVDLHTRRLPLPISHLGAVAIGVAAVARWEPGRLVASVVAAGCMAVIAQVLAKGSRGALGRGDVHYCLPLGATLGFFAGSAGVARSVLLAWAVTAAAAGGVIVVGLARRRLSRRSTVPYGPFLTLGACCALLVAVSA